MTSTGRITFGANNDWFDVYKLAAPGAHGLRYYVAKPYGTTPSTDTGVVPASYSGLMINPYDGSPSHTIPAGTKALITLYLYHSQLLAGTFDTALKTFFASCPSPTYISLWQEVGTIDWDSKYPATSPGGYANVGPGTIAAMNTYMQNLINAGRHPGGWGNTVKFGPITCGNGQMTMQGDSEYNRELGVMQGGPYDYYGIDPYFNIPQWGTATKVSQNLVNEHMNLWYDAAGGASHKAGGSTTPPVVVTETNASSYSLEPDFYRFMATWMNSNHGVMMLTHWVTATTPQSNTFPPPSKWGNSPYKGVIQAMNDIQGWYGN